MIPVNNRFGWTKKGTFLSLLGFILFLVPVRGQCVYTSVGSGNWTNPAIWSVSGGGCASIPTANSTVVINTPVTLNTNISFLTSGGRDGTLTINAAGRLIEDATPRSITFGSGSGSLVNRFTHNGALQVSTMTFNKSGGTFNAAATVKCTFSLQLQAAININSAQLTIEGNYQLDNGNVSSGGGGSMVIKGCVTGPNGALISSIISPLTVCVLNQTGSACATGTCNGNIPLNNVINCSIALPVVFEWVDAIYEPAHKRTKISWKSATEENNDYYQVERSSDGTDFDSIGVVKGAGNSSAARNYTFYDADPSAGFTYYRIRQVDYNGRSTRSKTVVAATETQSPDVKVTFSSPARMEINFTSRSKDYQLQVYGIMGQLLFAESAKGAYPNKPVHKEIRLPAVQTFYTLCLITESVKTIRKILVIPAH